MAPVASTSVARANRAGDHPDRVGLWGAVWLTLAASAVLVAALVTAALWVFGFPTLRRDGVVSAETMFTLFKLVLAVVAGVGGVVALVVAYRRQKNGEAERAQADVRLLVERFGKASELIGSDKAAVRLAGVHALAGLADDWRLGRQTCVDVLCGYLRMPFVSPYEYWGHPSNIAPWHAAMQELQVRQTIVRIIAAHLAEDAACRWDTNMFDFTGAAFDGADLRGARFTSGVTMLFRQSRFRAGTVDFAGAAFVGGTVDLSEAEYAGGTVDLSSLAENPPTPPAGLILPAVPPASLRMPSTWTPAAASS
jgi:hypothetical protein